MLLLGGQMAVVAERRASVGDAQSSSTSLKSRPGVSGRVEPRRDQVFSV